MKFFDKLFADRVDPVVVLQAQAAVGNQFLKRFDQDDVMKLVFGRAEQERERALSTLMNVDPKDAIRIIQLQERARQFDSLLRWIEETVNEGEAAKEALEQIDAEERPY